MNLANDTHYGLASELLNNSMNVWASETKTIFLVFSVFFSPKCQYIV